MAIVCQKRPRIWNIQLKIPQSLFSKDWCIHTFICVCLENQSSRVCLGVHFIPELLNTSVNISWTVEGRTHFTRMPGGWCPTVQVPHTLLDRVAAKNGVIYSSSVNQRDRPHKNGIQATASIRVVHHVLVVYCFSPCVAMGLTVVNSFSANGEKVPLNWAVGWSRLAAALQNSHDSK